MSDTEGQTAAESEGPPIPVGRLVRRLLALAWRHRMAALPAVAATLLYQILTLAVLAGQGLVIDAIRAEVDAGAPAPSWPAGLSPPEEWGLTARLGAVAGVIALAAGLAAVARFFTRYCDELFVQACVVDLRRRLHDKLQRLPFSFFDGTDTGKIINRVTGDSQQVRAFIQGVMIRAGIAGASLAVFLSYMLATHAWLTAACVVFFPAQVLVMARFSRVTKPKYLELSRRTDGAVKALQETIAGIRVTRVFGQEEQRRALFRERCERLRGQSLEIARDQSLHLPAVNAGNILAQAVLLGYGGWLVLEGPPGGIALGALWVFRGLLDRLAAQAEAIVSIISEAPESLAGAERVFRLLDRPVEIEGPDPGPGDAPIGGSVEFRGVWFGYDPATPVLRDVSFRVEQGETVALVGPTGSGKSTLLSLIARFHDPQRGGVLIDGRDARQIPLRTLRRSVAFVFQEPFLFSATVRENIAFGRPEAPADAVAAAAADASASPFIAGLPGGYETVIGERGVSLSGGQRQRLTIARALLTDPAVLVLDDATGGIDPETETEVLESLDRRRRGRTTFVVAHRLSTLRRADRIVVLEAGRVIDTGTHEELMTRPGHYRAAALIQLALEEGERPARDGPGAERSAAP